MKFFQGFLLFFLLTFIISCDKGENEMPAGYGFDYFPIRKGQFTIFNIDKIVYSELSPPETLAYDLKTEVMDSFLNNAGDYTYVMYNSTRPDESGEWEYAETLSVRSSNNEVVVTEGSVPYVKLSFPLKINAVWNGNKRNSSEADEYKIVSFDQALTINGMELEKTLTVEQEMYDDGITRTDERMEVYARGVGLVRRRIRQLTYCTEPICINDRIIESGIIFEQEIKDHGLR